MARSEGDTGPHPVDRHVGRRIAEKRIALGYNQSDLGRALNLTFQQIQKYEKGTNRVSASKLWMIAQFFKVDLTYFFEGVSVDGWASDAQDAVSGPNPTRQSLEITSIVPRLSPTQQKLLLDLARSMASPRPGNA